jgi:hypothetical protein
MTRLITLLAFFAISASATHAQIFKFSRAELVISPGVKLQIPIDPSGPVGFGLELSAGFWYDRKGSFVGCVIDYDLFGDRRKLHFGFEASVQMIGLEAGPTLIFENGQTTLAASVTPYGAFFLIMPYYTQTFNFAGLDLSEWGFYLKCPFRADGQELFNHL